MEQNTQEEIDNVLNRFGQIKNQFDKLDGITGDLNNCNSEYSKTILMNAVSKLSEQIGIKDKLFS